MIETLVIGGGPAGAGAAIKLARAGRQVVLLEREKGPHDKVCGEFLSARACAVLTDLGLDLDGLGARLIDQVAPPARDKRSEFAPSVSGQESVTPRHG